MTCFAAASAPKGDGANKDLIFLIKEIGYDGMYAIDTGKLRLKRWQGNGWLAELRGFQDIIAVVLLLTTTAFTKGLLGARRCAQFCVFILSPNPHILGDRALDTPPLLNKLAQRG